MGVAVLTPQTNECTFIYVKPFGSLFILRLRMFFSIQLCVCTVEEKFPCPRVFRAFASYMMFALHIGHSLTHALPVTLRVLRMMREMCVFGADVGNAPSQLDSKE